MAPATAGPTARGKSALPINVLISALVVIALVPSAILFVQLWQDMMRPHSVTLPVTAPPAAEPPRTAGLDYPKKVAMLEAKDTARFEAKDNDVEETAPPAVAVTDDVGWSFASDQSGALSVPAPIGPTNPTTMTAEPEAGDGAPLAQHETLPSTTPSPAETEMADAADSNPFEQTGEAAPSEAAVPLPQRKPAASAGTAPTVRTVKVVTIEPPRPTRPHDGAYALGSPSDEAQAPAEWMETKTAVDMHAKAEQSSETVKVAEGGVKMRVTARDKNWVKVTDPKSSTTGWIYNRFLQPAEPPAP
jgi:hypothetical protein